MNETIYLGADHAGFDSKEKIKKYLLQKKYKVIDCGNKRYNANDDYPDFAFKVAKEVAYHRGFGILFCGSAEGMSIAANKVRGIRAVVAHDITEAKLTREHNDSNILSLAGRFLTEEEAKAAVKKWLETPHDGAERHTRRHRMLDENT